MSIEANKEVVKAFFAAFNRGDVDAALDLLANDMTWTLTGTTPLSGTYRGKDSVRDDFFGKVMQQIDHDAPLEINVIELIAEGDKVVARTEGRVTGKYGPYNNTYCHVFTVTDGLIRANMEFLDTVLVEQALFGKS